MSLKADKIKKVAVIGAGTMGSGIAQVVASANREVVLLDISAEAAQKGKGTVEKGLGRLVKKEKMTAKDSKAILSRIHPTGEYGDITDCDLVIEAVFEDIDIKLETFDLIDGAVGPEVVIATNTSSLPIIELAVETGRADKIVGMHFFNPAPVMKLVEIIKTLATSDETAKFAFDFAKALGKEPVMTVDQPGFIVNRILIPMLNEAVFALEEGVGSAEDIDNAIKLGAGHPMGPLALIDLIGLDVTLEVLDVLYAEFGDPKFRPAPLLRQMVRAGRLGRKSGRGFFEY